MLNWKEKLFFVLILLFSKELFFFTEDVILIFNFFFIFLFLAIIIGALLKNLLLNYYIRLFIELTTILKVKQKYYNWIYFICTFINNIYLFYFIIFYLVKILLNKNSEIVILNNWKKVVNFKIFSFNTINV